MSAIERLRNAYEQRLNHAAMLSRDATYCPDCDAVFEPHDDGYDEAECFECGARNVFKIEW